MSSPARAGKTMISTDLLLARSHIPPELRRSVVPVALAAIVTLAAVVRLASLDDNPPGFFADEASAGYNAYSVLTTGRDEHGRALPLLFRAFGEYKLGVYIYSQIPFIAVFGLSEVAVRLTSAVYGVLTVVPIYLLASTLFRSKTAGVCAAFFLAIMPWHIHYSRTGFGELVSFPFYLTLGLWLALLGTRRPAFWPAAGLVLGLSLHTYRAAWVTVPPLLLLFAALYRREVARGWPFALAGTCIIAVAAVPLFVHLFLGAGDRSGEVSLVGMDLGLWGTTEQFWHHYKTYFSICFLFEEGDGQRVTRHYLPEHGHLYHLQFPFIVLGLAGALWVRRREAMIPLGLIAVYPLGGALTAESPISSRSIIGSIGFALLTTYGLLVMLDLVVRGLRLVRPLRRLTVPAISALLIGLVALSSSSLASYLGKYHREYPELAADFWGWQYGPREAVEYFVRVEEGYDDLILDGTFNAPEIFYQFYAPNRCGNCMIGSTDRYDPGRRQLFALRPESMPIDFRYETKHVVHYPSGEPVLHIVEIDGLRFDVAEPDPAWGIGGRLLPGLGSPEGMAIGPRGDLYFVERSGDVRVFDSTGELLHAWPSGLNEATDIAVDARGFVYISAAEGSVRLFLPAGQPDRERRGAVTVPRGIDVAEDGTLFIASTGGSRIIAADLDSDSERALQPRPAPDGTRFLQPIDVAVADDVLFAVAAEQPAIWKLTADGAHVLHWALDPIITVRGPQLAWADGVLLMTDPERQRVLGFDREGDLILLTRIRESADSPFAVPLAIAADGNAFWVTDALSGRVFRFVIDGER